MKTIYATRTINTVRAALAVTLAVGAGILGGVVTNAAQLPAAHAQQEAMMPSGAFRKLAHKTTGKASVVKGAKNGQALRLTNFETGKGPKLHVYLVAAADIKDNDAVKKLVDGKMFVDLGALKSIKGNQTYAIPAGTDLSKYQTAVIWCDQFDVSFGAATLQ